MEDFDMATATKRAIARASEGKSWLPPDVTGIDGLTSNKIRHVLNGICGSIPDLRYLEVGLFCGATFSAAMYENKGTFLGIDNFVFNHMKRASARLKEHFVNSAPGVTPGDEVEALVREQAVRYAGDRAQVIRADSFGVSLDSISARGPFNVYFYDGDHSNAAQARAMTHFEGVLADELVFMVDDWNGPDVRDGTFRGMEEAGYEVVFQWEGFTPGNGDVDTWWNGLFVSVLRRVG